MHTPSHNGVEKYQPKNSKTLCRPTVRVWHKIQTLLWRHNEPDCVSNHQPHDCLLNRLSGTDQRKHQSSASLAFVRGIHRRPVNSPHKWPVTRKMFPFDDVIMSFTYREKMPSPSHNPWDSGSCWGQKLCQIYELETWDNVAKTVIPLWACL